MISSKEWAKRRQTLLKKCGPSAIAILPSAPIAMRNGEYEYPYRQNSNFYYLTGFTEPEAIAVLAAKRKEGEFILFNRPHHRERELWEGPRAGQEGARKKFGAHQAYAIKKFTEQLPKLLMDRTKVYTQLGVNPEFDVILLDAFNKARTTTRTGITSPAELIDIGGIVHEMRLIKSPTEIKIMRESADISAAAHISAMQACLPGIQEYQLEAELLYEFQLNGARHPAYTSIVGSGANTCILHYNANNKTIANNSLVLVDAGGEYQYYASDITRTFPANGKFTKEQAAVYNVVLAAQLAAIKIIKPGITWNKMHETAVKVLTQGLIKIGLLRGKLSDLIANKAYFPFFMHRTGHWLGLDVHDVGQYTINKKWRKLQAGMVLTVEPGIYISNTLKNVPARWHNIGVRIEDDILVTKTGHEVLSKRAPKTIADIEALMA